MWEKASNAFRSVFRYVDEAASAGRGAGRAGAETTEEAGERVGQEVLEESGERAGREVAEEAGERTGRETAEEAGEGTRRRADEAAKAAEYPEALAAAKAITNEFNRMDAPAPALNAALNALRRRYRWIDRFEVRPKRRPGQYAVYMIASEHVVDKDVNLDEEEGLPEGGISIEARAAAGGRPPGYARERPGAYYYDTTTSRYRRRPDTSMSPEAVADDVSRQGRRQRKSSLRYEHRRDAALRLQESVRSGIYDPASLRTAEHLGPDQLAEIADAEDIEDLMAVMSKHDLEFHHAPRLADMPTSPDPGARSYLAPREVHREVEHGGDFRRPLETGEPAAPDALTTREPLTDPEDGLQSALGRGSVDDQFAESFGWQIIETADVEMGREELLWFLRNTEVGQEMLERLIVAARARPGTSRQQIEFLERLRR